MEELQSLLDLCGDWELVHYDNLEKIWVGYIRERPDLIISDLDLTHMKIGEGLVQAQMGVIDPLFIFIGSAPLSSIEGSFAASHGAFDYIPKPVNLGKVVLALAVAEGAK